MPTKMSLILGVIFGFFCGGMCFGQAKENEVPKIGKISATVTGKPLVDPEKQPKFFHTLLHGYIPDYAPATLKTPDFDQVVQASLSEYVSLSTTFRAKPGNIPYMGTSSENAFPGRKKALEEALVCLCGGPRVEKEAADYAGQAILRVEWEGMMDGPRSEIDFAEKYLLDHPGTSLEPFITVFLLHRYKALSEIARQLNQEVPKNEAIDKYIAYRKKGECHGHPLVRLAAKEIIGAPWVYRMTIGSKTDVGFILKLAATPSQPLPVPEFRPPVEMEAARELAMKFVREKKTDLSRQYLASVTLQFDKGKNMPYWHFQWSWRQPRLGMEYGVDVYMDKTVVERQTGP